ncbi:gluconokinase [Mucilaginibacter psychrotolerans]|uniref:Gluconokinase n=1 Tax=Mucilaginibacter psychrotolerans TaxID=1524096 RepID=A0A4Y8SKR3_9SPHI|nr:gluconokinase [Mucilaginibacter psychrotolerans]TFF39251.1 gluconokinase [Mucilaginibacter psychrotolerans]
MHLQPTQKYFIGIDLGTGSTKAVAVDEAGKTLCTAQQHYTAYSPEPGVSEQDAIQVWDAFLLCINNITGQMGTAPAAVSFSAAMHSIMPVDGNGHPLAKAMLWADTRSGDIARAIRDSVDGGIIYRNTGTAIYAMSPLSKLIWLCQNQPALFAAAHKFISIKEYIWYRLFGVFEVDYSIASATGLLDIIHLDWYDASLSLAGIERDRLSQPVSTGHMRFTATAQGLALGVDAQTAFVIGSSDGCCANLGGNAVRPGVAALTIGTSGAVRVGSTQPVYNYQAMTFNYLLNAETFICGGAVNNGGAAVDWLIKSFLKLSITDQNYAMLFDKIDAVNAGSDGLIFLPYLYAERAPVWDAKSSAAFLGINIKHQQQHFMRAALEGICFALYDVLNAVEASSAEPVKEIVVSGGFINSPVWVQILADITGKKLVLLQGGDSSAMGAIYLAMQALGLDVQAILDTETANSATVEPNVQRHHTYGRIFPIYKKLYSDLKDSMRLMRDLNL